VIIHVYAGIETVHEMTEHVEEHHHDEHSVTWLLVGTIAAWVLIALGEYRLHRTAHCDTHHAKLHAHCHDEDCEETHEKPLIQLRHYMMILSIIAHPWAKRNLVKLEQDMFWWRNLSCLHE
jgi:hypothetical protein